MKTNLYISCFSVIKAGTASVISANAFAAGCKMSRPVDITENIVEYSAKVRLEQSHQS